MRFTEDSLPECLCDDKNTWDIISDLEFRHVKKIRYVQHYRHYTEAYVDKNTPSINILIVVLRSANVKISTEFIDAISDECYSLPDFFTNEIRFYYPERCSNIHTDCILQVERRKVSGVTRTSIVAATDKTAPAVS